MEGFWVWRKFLDGREGYLCSTTGSWVPPKPSWRTTSHPKNPFWFRFSTASRSLRPRGGNVRGTPYSNLFFIIFPCFSLFFYIFSVIISFFYRFYLISRPFFTRSIRFSHAYVIPLRTIFLRIYLYLFIFLCALQHIYITITSSPFASVTYRCTGRGGSLELSLWILSCPGVYPYCTYRSM